MTKRKNERGNYERRRRWRTTMREKKEEKEEEDMGDEEGTKYERHARVEEYRMCAPIRGFRCVADDGGE